MKEFSKWTIDEVEDYFQVKRMKTLPAFAAWLSADMPLTPEETARLQVLGAKLDNHVYDWNEEELKIRFIGGLLELVDYDHPEYQVFFERRLSVKMNNERFAGDIDCVIARGQRVPKRPLFCLQEYKPEKHSSNDPLGQVLAAMIAAQYLNQDEKPVYGAYVMGRNWYFVVLDCKAYAVSPEHDATQDTDLTRIFNVLRSIKAMIEQELQKNA